MTVSLGQGLIISLFAIIAGADFWLEGFYIFRPMIVCTITGLLLGDLKLGIIAGGLTELAFAGLTPVGGTQPPNPIMAGIMTVVLAYTTGHNPATAIGLSLPFSILMQYIVLFYYSAFSLLTRKTIEYAGKAETKKIYLDCTSSNIYCCSYIWYFYVLMCICSSSTNEQFSKCDAWLVKSWI